MLDFANMTVAQLKAHATTREIPNRSKLTKAGLIAALEKAYAKTRRMSNIMREVNYQKQDNRVCLSPAQQRRIRKNRFTHV